MNRVIRLLWSVCLAMSAACASATDFYVSPSGDDDNPGSQSRPFATLERARDAVRVLRREGRPIPGGITIFLRGGDYRRRPRWN